MQETIATQPRSELVGLEKNLLAAMWRFTKNNGIAEGFHRKETHLTPSLRF
jgi:hypothetical protein